MLILDVTCQNLEFRMMKNEPVRTALSLMLLLLFSTELVGDEKSVKTLILPGESFLVDGRPAFILWPEEAKRSTPQPWVLYGPTLPGLPDKHEKWMHQKILEAGIAVAGIDVGEAYGSPAGQALFDQLHAELTTNRKFAPKPCLLGRSRGGLLVTSWAISNPQKVAGLAGIYPVFDLRSYPGLKRAAPAFGMEAEELEKQLPSLNPVARVSVLAENSIPVFLIHGDVDRVVPIEENSLTVIQEFERYGKKELATLITYEGQGHNYWEGFFRCQELISFVIKTSNAAVHSSSE